MSKFRVCVVAASVVLTFACDSPSAAPRSPVPARIVIVSGDGQEHTVGEQLPASLVVRVEDADGAPLPNQLLNFEVVAGRGTVLTGATLTDANGLAHERWTLGTVAVDTQQVMARIIDRNTGQSLLFTSFAAVGKPSAAVAVVLVGGPDRSGPVGMPLSDSVAVKITDRYGNGVPGTAVEFHVQTGGGAVSPATTATDERGVARAEWTLGMRLDSTHVMHAAIANAPPVLLRAQGVTPPNVVVTRIAGDGQAGTVATELSEPLVVLAALPDGRPLIGAVVRWVISAGGGAVTPAAATTDETGRVTAQWTLGTVPGTISSTAVVDGASAVMFAATARIDVPASLTKFGGDLQAAALGKTLPAPLAARITDRYGNPAAGVLVQWAVTGQGGSAQPASSFTDSNGVARTSWTLGTSPGEPAVTATSGTLTPVSFAAAARIQPTRLRFLAQPGASEGSIAIDPAPQIVIQDEYGNTDTSASGGVTIALAANTSGATLSGTVMVDAVAGVATLGNLRIDRPGSYTVVATLPGLSPDTSSTFRVGLTFTSIAAGTGSHTCATTVAQATYCWGRNREGQLGDMSTSNGSATPVHVAPVGATFTRVYPGTLHTCALTAEGVAYCWGWMQLLGIGTYALPNRVPPVPVEAPPGMRFTKLMAADQTCGVTTVGELYCWGIPPYMNYGPLLPTRMPLPTGVQLQTASMGGYTCAISTTGELYCWGGIHYTSAPQLVATPPGVTFADVVVGFRHSCGLAAAGQAYCWGVNGRGELGDGTAAERWAPAPVATPAGVAFTKLTAGSGHTCGITVESAVYCWGSNESGQIGDGTTVGKATPVLLALPGGKRATDVSAGNAYTCVRATDGSAYCWGNNDSGKLGDGQGSGSSVPVAVTR